MAEAEGQASCPLLVFADDWGRHPSSCQHLMRNLLGQHEVYWVNTIGTRRPRLEFATLRRGLEKIRHWTRSVNGATAWPANLHVLNPRMWPWFGSRLSRRLNRRLLVRQIVPVLEQLPSEAVAVTTLPIVADLMEALPVRRWVYYCVDDFSEWPGLDQAVLRRLEEQVIRRADVLIAVSEMLQEKLGRMGRPAHLLTHGVDLDHWTVGDEQPSPAAVAGLERPLVVFWGVVDRRMDVRFVSELAADLTRGTIVLAGPEADPDSALYESRRVVPVGPLPYEQLPALAREAAVLVMPYADLPVTRAMQPLKLKEYLATGKPVVARDLPAVREWADCLDIARTPREFSGAVRRRLGEGLPEEQREARRRLAQESWAEKACELRRLALGLGSESSVHCQG